MATIDEQKKIHGEIMKLFDQFRDLRRQIFTLRETIGELDHESQRVGKKIYELYKISGDGMNGEDSG